MLLEAAPHLFVCATDAGGAAVTGHVARLAREAGWRLSIFSGPAAASRFRHYGLEPEPVADGFERNLTGDAVDAILLGTTRYESAERVLTRWAKKEGVPSIAVLDDWSRYTERFPPNGPDACLPDLICAPDGVAVEGLVGAGIPKEQICATGSPALADTAGRLEEFAENPPPRPECFCETDHPVFLFLSETHIEDFGTALDAPGPLGPYLGFTELSVREELAEVLRPRGMVIEKLHPSDTRDYQNPEAAGESGWLTVRDVSLWDFLWHADFVLGMLTIALTESALLRRPTASFQPGAIGPDMCAASRMRLIPRFTDRNELGTWLDEPVMPVALDKSPAFATADAAANVLSAVRKLAGV